MIHRAAPSFWDRYEALDRKVQKLVDKSFDVLKRDPQHSSLRLKKISRFWSARIGLHHRALAFEISGGLLWIWIGDHNKYDQLVG